MHRTPREGTLDLTGDEPAIDLTDRTHALAALTRLGLGRSRHPLVVVPGLYPLG